MKSGVKAGLMLAAVMLQACSVAPGMRMDQPAVLGPEGTVVRITPITLTLLEQMEADRQAAAHKVIDEFVAKPERYRIGPSDVLQITVWDHPELTIPAGSFRDAASSGQQVGDDGMLYFPYVGVIQASGQTVSELRELLTHKLSTYIMNPQLDVRVVAYRSKKVYVVGEVNKPGVLPLDDVPLMITDAISLSGGLTDDGYKSGVNVSRDGKVYEIDLRELFDFADASQNLMLKHGDIVNVPDRSQQKVFMLGEVARPSSVEILNGRLSLAAALGEVGGPNQNSANSGAIYVIRGADEVQPQIFHLDARYATGLLMAERFEMQAQDIVFVDTAGISQWNRVISQLLPSATFINIAESVGRP